MTEWRRQMTNTEDVRGDAGLVPETRLQWLEMQKQWHTVISHREPVTSNPLWHEV